jgi:hypothetical protein
MNFGNKTFRYFYNKEIYLATFITTRNEIGQEINTYTKSSTPIPCDIQPIDEKSYKYTWGEDIEATFQVFCDELFKVDDIIVYENKIYKVEKISDWTDYRIYAIKSSDEEVITA